MIHIYADAGSDADVVCRMIATDINNNFVFA